jgi:sugar phosphate permease
MMELRQRAAVYFGFRRPPAPAYLSRRNRMVALVFAMDIAVLVVGLFVFVGNNGHGWLVFVAIAAGVGFLLGGYSLLVGLRRR